MTYVMFHGDLHHLSPCFPAIVLPRLYLTELTHMQPVLMVIFLLPLLISGLLLIFPVRISGILVTCGAFLLSAFSVYLFFNLREPFFFTVPAMFNEIATAADVLLLLYFGWMGLRERNRIVLLLSVLQLAMLLYLINILPHETASEFMVDRLSVFMFLLINIISGVIAIYSLQYIAEEDCSSFRRKFFLSVMFWFIAVMNLAVAADNLEYFFLFFELTTLASFLFIGFRKDEVSVNNAYTALWMNQVGGLAILLSIFFIAFNEYGAITFSNLLAHASAEGIMLPLALLAFAALVKGAQMPFSKWLLGAMVAPTPVSALLHSSTMVKIAPFMLLRLSPALRDTPVAMVVIALTAFVFVAAAIESLSQDNFKRILAHSTIALLALMMMMSAIGSPLTIVAALTLMLFHGIAKSMLFLNAGILERVFHIKQSSDMDRLGESGPFTALVITLGFMSLLLPPFGAFMGKWLSIETLGDYAMNTRLFGAVIIVAVACGGAVLSLLYFKVLGLLISRSGDKDSIRFEHTGTIYSATTWFLLLLTIISAVCLPLIMINGLVPVASQLIGLPVIVALHGWNLQLGSITLSLLPLLLTFFLLPGTVVAALFVRFRHTDRAKEYMCGEDVAYSFSSFYFSTDKVSPYFSSIGILFFVALIIVAML